MNYKFIIAIVAAIMSYQICTSFHFSSIQRNMRCFQRTITYRKSNNERIVLVENSIDKNELLQKENLSGLCAVYKPSGISSSFVVGKIKYILQRHCTEHIFEMKQKCKIKVGHGGTLDPMAEGVLVLGIGSGTKVMRTFLSGSKGYYAVGKLGTRTDTLDCTGKVTERISCDHIKNDDTISQILPQYVGDIQQIPPMFSALHKDGNRLYDLARAGIEVERQPRPVTVYKLNIAPPQPPFYRTKEHCDLDWLKPGERQQQQQQQQQQEKGSDDISENNEDSSKLPYFGLEIESSGGFYVRTLIDDVGKALGTAAHMTQLLRTKQGPFELQDCLPPEKWTYEEIKKHIQVGNSKIASQVELSEVSKDSFSD